MTTYLITGGAGFIGSNFVHYLRKAYPEDRILVLDLLTYAGSLDNLPPAVGPDAGRIQFWHGDVRNASLVDSLVEQSDVVVHFAAETHVTRSIYDNYHFFETDVLGTQVVANSVVRHIANVERFIHVSTSEVYGTAQGAKMDEDHPLMPMSPYAAAKAGADRLVYSYFATYNVPAIIVRPFNQFGPRQHLEKVIPRFITSCLLDEPLRIHGDGSAARDFTYVEDTCRAIDALAHSGREHVVGEVINLGTGVSLSLSELASKIVRRMNKPETLINYVGDRPGQVFRHTADTAKAKRLLGWTPDVSFDEGLDRTIEWYIAHRPWWEKQLWMREIPIITKTGKRELH
ncbi:MAG: GDP-mannose 4,6-dehydratase [Vicinamibacterales bacterium]